MAMSLAPLTRSFGVEVSGLDLRDGVGADNASRLRQIFEEDGLLLFRNVDFSAEQQRRWGEIFGEVRVRPGIPTATPVREEGTQYISNSRDDGILGNGELTFHQDHLYLDQPLRGLMLYGMTIPASGSATKFRSCTAIYDALDEATARAAEGVRCLHAFDFGGDYEKGVDPRAMTGNSSRAWQPLIWRGSPTGRPAVWVADWSIAGFDGIGPEAGAALIAAIWEQAAAVEEYRHEWRVGDLLLWNNLLAQHARLPFNTAEPRTLRRTPIL
ncbi:MAG TPA: TauD/TfdA family dioxygenase [Sphingomonadaceae bacterium]|nr:TauD/TfdA family dioxygenase [Sphingomonadaceae bacterium]